MPYTIMAIENKMFQTGSPSNHVKANNWWYCDCVVFVCYHIQPENILLMWTLHHCRKGAEKLIHFTRYVRSVNMKGPPIFYLLLQQARGTENRTNMEQSHGVWISYLFKSNTVINHLHHNIAHSNTHTFVLSTWLIDKS